MKDVDLQELLNLTKSALDKANKDLGFVKPLLLEKKAKKELEPFDPEKHIGFIGIHPKQWAIKETYEYNDLRQVAKNLIGDTPGTVTAFKEALRKINDTLGVKISEQGDVVASEGKKSSINEIFSSLQLSTIMHSIINGQKAQAAGSIFESFIAALIGGRGTNNDDSKIEDLFDEGGNPISLKVISSATQIKGSARNLAKTLATSDKDVVYLVCVKNTESDPLSFRAFHFKINRNNYFNFISGKDTLSAEDVIYVVNTFPTIAAKMAPDLKRLKSVDVKRASAVTAYDFSAAEYKQSLGDAIFSYAKRSGDPTLVNTDDPREIENIIVSRFENLLKAANEQFKKLNMDSLSYKEEKKEKKDKEGNVIEPAVVTMIPFEADSLTSLAQAGKGPFLQLGTTLRKNIADVEKLTSSPDEQTKRDADETLKILSAMKEIHDGINSYLGTAFTTDKVVSDKQQAEKEVLRKRQIMDAGLEETFSKLKKDVENQYPELYKKIIEDVDFKGEKYTGGLTQIYKIGAQAALNQLYRNYNDVARNAMKIAYYMEDKPDLKAAYDDATDSNKLPPNSAAAAYFSNNRSVYEEKFKKVAEAMRPFLTAFNQIREEDPYAKERLQATLRAGMKAKESLNADYKHIIDAFWANEKLIAEAGVKEGKQFSIPSNDAKNLAARIGADLDVEYPTVLVGSSRLFKSAETNADMLKTIIEPVFKSVHELRNGLKTFFIYNEIEGLEDAKENGAKVIESAENLKTMAEAEKGTQTAQTQPAASLAESKKSNKQVLTDDDVMDILKMIL